MTDQELITSVAQACGLKVIVAESHQWEQHESMTNNSVVFWSAFPNEARLVHKVEGDQYTTSWDPLDDLKLAFECAEKVWTSVGWSFAVHGYGSGEYSCCASDDKVCTSGGAFDSPARAICHAIRTWRTGEES